MSLVWNISPSISFSMDPDARAPYCLDLVLTFPRKLSSRSLVRNHHINSSVCRCSTTMKAQAKIFLSFFGVLTKQVWDDITERQNHLPSYSLRFSLYCSTKNITLFDVDDLVKFSSLPSKKVNNNLLNLLTHSVQTALLLLIWRLT